MDYLKNATIQIDNGKGKDITIKIWYSDPEQGFMYDIFENHTAEEILQDDDIIPDDGGVCTGSFEDSISMSVSQALNN